ncbi:hypothetical protein HDV00_011378 [Rhizophlyctis rosea]|nr:hypothetical protein HDV00_011378 [Rhizophlyctis rosea]
MGMYYRGAAFTLVMMEKEIGLRPFHDFLEANDGMTMKLPLKSHHWICGCREFCGDAVKVLMHQKFMFDLDVTGPMWVNCGCPLLPSCSMLWHQFIHKEERWTKRTWTWQEGWIGDVEVFMHPDTLVTNLECFGDGAFVNGSLREVDTGGYRKAVYGNLTAMHPFRQWKEKEHEYHMPAASILMELRDRGRSVPHDAFYAGLGLLRYGSKIKVDYSLGVREAFKRFAVQCMENGDRSILLSNSRERFPAPFGWLSGITDGGIVQIDNHHADYMFWSSIRVTPHGLAAKMFVLQLDALKRVPVATSKMTRTVTQKRRPGKSRQHRYKKLGIGMGEAAYLDAVDCVVGSGSRPTTETPGHYSFMCEEEQPCRLCALEEHDELSYKQFSEFMQVVKRNRAYDDEESEADVRPNTYISDEGISICELQLYSSDFLHNREKKANEYLLLGDVKGDFLVGILADRVDGQRKGAGRWNGRNGAGKTDGTAVLRFRFRRIVILDVNDFGDAKPVKVLLQ